MIFIAPETSVKNINIQGKYVYSLEKKKIDGIERRIILRHLCAHDKTGRCSSVSVCLLVYQNQMLICARILEAYK